MFYSLGYIETSKYTNMFNLGSAGTVTNINESSL